MLNKKLRAGVVGATGMVGQRFVSLLADHPYFTPVLFAASASSAGKKYKDAVAGRWKLSSPMPEYAADMTVCDAADIEKIKRECDFVFCAVNMPKAETKALEEAYASAGIPVVSNNSANRNTPDVPMMVPEINYSHLKVIPYQQKRLGTKTGFIAVKPNCSIQSYAPVIAALRDFEPYEVLASTYQAISGAGRTFEQWPEMVDNVIPFISGEEEKSEKEPLKLLGKVENGVIVPCEGLNITTQCIRVPVSDGHLATVFMKFRKKPTKEQFIEATDRFGALPGGLKLPSSPDRFITYFSEDDRPQTKLDRMLYNGMGVCYGRLREDSIFDWKFVGLSHNTLRGAAGGAVLIAELLAEKGYIGG